MKVQRLKLTSFRNLDAIDWQPSPGLNLIYGQNASGKTSLLEALYLLSLVRSFRSKKLQRLIAHEQSHFTVFAQLQNQAASSLPLAIQRDHQKGETQVALYGQRPQSLAELAAILPMQLINPDAFRLLEGSPRERRQFLDWGVFHVEQYFIGAWQRFQRALKQRNSLLRHGRIDSLQLDLWEKELAVTGEQVTRYRQAYLNALKPVFFHILNRLLALGDDCSLHFLRGWDKAEPLLDTLKRQRIKDIEQGFTQVGPQRADIRISVRGHPAMEVLSRGQQKLVVSALKLAQGELLAQAGNKSCIYLIDDLPAELDFGHRTLFCQMLEAQKSQVFITSVEAQALAIDWKYPEKTRWFHVKQGALYPDDPQTDRALC